MQNTTEKDGKMILGLAFRLLLRTEDSEATEPLKLIGRFYLPDPDKCYPCP